MSLLRRLTIVASRFPGAKSLSCIDLTNQLFGKATPPPPTIEDESISEQYSSQILEHAAALKMGTFQIPNPIINCQATSVSIHQFNNLDCFHLTDGKVLFTDNYGRTILFDSDACNVFIMPNLHKPKQMPISLFVPRATDAGGGSLYIMEMIPTPERGYNTPLSEQFEAFVCSKPNWHCQLLPPPPFVRDLTNIRRKIMSYAVVGSDICISVECAGTFLLDTVSNTWDKVGRWMLPFSGKVEYVPELKLWFGFSAQDEHFAAADLATMDSQPQLLADLKEIEPSEEWMEADDSRIVNLGSGRFCIVTFLETLAEREDRIVVLTGVEATRRAHGNSCGSSGAGTGNGGVTLTKHKSICHVSDEPLITDVF